MNFIRLWILFLIIVGYNNCSPAETQTRIKNIYHTNTVHHFETNDLTLLDQEWLNIVKYKEIRKNNIVMGTIDQRGNLTRTHATDIFLFITSTAPKQAIYKENNNYFGVKISVHDEVLIYYYENKNTSKPEDVVFTGTTLKVGVLE